MQNEKKNSYLLDHVVFLLQNTNIKLMRIQKTWFVAKNQLLRTVFLVEAIKAKKQSFFPEFGCHYHQLSYWFLMQLRIRQRNCWCAQKTTKAKSVFNRNSNWQSHHFNPRGLLKMKSCLNIKCQLRCYK